MIPPVLIFDLDKTLARSKQPITPSMAEELEALLAKTAVAIISGDPLPVLEHNVIRELSIEARKNLYLLPTSGAALYDWNGYWQGIYEESIAEAEVPRIEEAIKEACVESGLVDLEIPAYGERIENRGPQITLSALGQEAPIEEKEAWDPDGVKKSRLRSLIAAKLPEYDVKVGGSTSVDVTKHGINKAYGVQQLSQYLRVPVAQMLYVGDALYPGGNDEVVKETGIATRQVEGPEDTKHLIRMLLD